MSSGNQPFKYESVELPVVSKVENSKHGTSVYVRDLKHIGLIEERVRSEIGLRFLTEPDFIVEGFILGCLLTKGS